MTFSELIERARAYLQAITHITNQITIFVPSVSEHTYKVADLKYHRNTNGATTTLNIEYVRTSLIVAANAVYRSIGLLCLAAI
jgi:hypothetical protein